MENAAETDALIGKDLGAYRIVRKLGAGGMGVVFEATHRQIGQRVAIKLLHNHIAKDGKTFLRFQNEAKAIGQIKHPGLVNIHGYEDAPDGAAYIVMEFLQGESLFDRLEKLSAEKKRLPIPQAVSLVRQVASALTEAHAAGIVHCDLKPENLFLVRDELVEFGERVKILDFGIAKFVQDDGGRKTTVGLVLGTPIYMSPEQCEGRDKISAKADVYSLGVMFYELLAGEPPFRADSSATLMRKHMIMEPPPIASKAQGVPLGVAQVLHRMLAKEPDQRPSMQELAASLEHPDRVAVAGAHRGRRGLVIAGSIAVLALGSLVVLRTRATKPPSVPPTVASPQVHAAAPPSPPPANTQTESRPAVASPDKDGGKDIAAAANVPSLPASGTAKKKRDKNAPKAVASKSTEPQSVDANVGKAVAEIPKIPEPKAEPPKETSDANSQPESPKKRTYGAFR